MIAPTASWAEEYGEVVDERETQYPNSSLVVSPLSCVSRAQLSPPSVACDAERGWEHSQHVGGGRAVRGARCQGVCGAWRTRAYTKTAPPL